MSGEDMPNGRPIISIKPGHLTVANWLTLMAIVVGGIWAAADLYFRVDAQGEKQEERQQTVDKRLESNERAVSDLRKDVSDIKTQIAVNNAVQKSILDYLSRIENQLSKLSDRFNERTDRKPQP